MDDVRVWQPAVGARAVVVGHNDIEAGDARGGHLVDGGNRAVGRDQQPRAPLCQARDGRCREAVAVLAAAGQKPVHVGTECAQDHNEDRGRADAVDVVVAVHGDPRSRLGVAEYERARVVDPGEVRRVVTFARFQKRTRRVWIAQPAAHKHLRERVADLELALEREDRGDGARLDLKARDLLLHPLDGTDDAGRNRRGRRDADVRARPAPR
jgi:hypothetical protein